MKPGPQFTIECPFDTGCWGHLDQMLRGYLAECPLSAQRRNRLLVAVSEAVMNGVCHGAPPVRVQIATDEESVQLWIRDSGAGFRTDTALPDTAKESGRGVPLMERLVDEFRAESNESGTTVWLKMHLDRPSVQQYSNLRRKSYDDLADMDKEEASMKVEVKRDGETAHLKLRGRLDLDSSAAVKEEIRRCLSQGYVRLVLDLEAVEFINSSGLGALVSALKEIRLAKGRLVVCRLAPYVREIFEITQLSHIFEIYATEGEALEALTAERARAKV